MSITIKKINDVKVKPMKLPKIDPKTIKGYSMFPLLYCNIFICAKKNSGKTTVIYNILKECANKLTTVIIFSSTVNNDDSFDYIIKKLNERGINVITYTSIHENGNQLENLINYLQESSKEEKEEDEQEEEEQLIKDVDLNFGDEKKKKEREYKPKKIAPKYILVFDDLANELKTDASFMQLLKTQRHYKCKTIISSQWPFDLKPEARTQIDYWLLFKGHSKKKLEIIYTDCDLAMEFDTFLKLYYYATAKPYNFLYIDRNKQEFRVNFSQKFNIPDD